MISAKVDKCVHDDLIPITPEWCDKDDNVSNDCWNACRAKFGPTAVAGCWPQPLLPGPKKMICKCWWPC